MTDQIKFLGEINRILKPGGYAIISTPVKVTKKPLDKNHVIEWFKDEYITLIDKHFPNSQYFYSHPIFWYELISYSTKWKWFVNLLSLIKDPFIAEGNWRFNTLQFSISKKPV